MGLGSCGWTSSDSDFIVALNQPMAQSDNHCGKQVSIQNTEKGVTQQATVVDECPGCAYGSLDMSPSLFKALNNGDTSEGEFPISWSFN